MAGEAISPPKKEEIHGATTERHNRPERSPYSSRLCAVRCQSHEPLYVSSALLQQSPVLASHYDRSLCNPSPIPELRLNDVNFNTGHVIIHFIITSTYQCLKPQQDSAAERNVSEFTTALDVYDAAHSYDLPGLRELARREIVRLGNRLDLPTFVGVMDNAKLALDKFPAIGVYVEWRFGLSIDPPEHLALTKMLSSIGAPKTLSMALLKQVLLLKAPEEPQKSESMADNISGVPLRHTDSDLGASLSAKSFSDVDQAMKEAEERMVLENKRLAAAADAEAAAKRINAAREAAKIEAGREEEEIQSLLSKRLKKGGRLLKKDTQRLDFLEQRAVKRAEDQAVRNREAFEAVEAGIAPDPDTDDNKLAITKQSLDDTVVNGRSATSQMIQGPLSLNTCYSSYPLDALAEPVRKEAYSLDDDGREYEMVTPSSGYGSPIMEN